MKFTSCTYIRTYRAVYRIFAKGGRTWSRSKIGWASRVSFRIWAKGGQNGNM